MVLELNRTDFQIVTGSVVEVASGLPAADLEPSLAADRLRARRLFERINNVESVTHDLYLVAVDLEDYNFILTAVSNVLTTLEPWELSDKDGS